MMRWLKQILVAWYTRIQMNYFPATTKGIQILLSLKYKDLLSSNMPLLKFEDVEFRVFSQNGEDGILLYIFSLIGTSSRKAVEVCAGNGIECNTANLIINHGWRGLLFDGDETNIKIGRDFYARCKDTYYAPPTLVKTWIDTENINSLIMKHGFQGEVDLLSLDMDGIDYWVWDSITCTNPRVVILEYNEQFGFVPVTVPYDPQFDRFSKDVNYWGASLSAFCHLAKQKGYRLVGCNRQRLNAVFIRNDVGTDELPGIPFECCMLKKPEEYTLLNELSKRFTFTHV